MYEIIPNLFISSYSDLKLSLINDNVYIINCTKDLPLMDLGYRISVDDIPDIENNRIMYDAFFSIIPIIENKLSKNIKVVVHCNAGRQRSASIVCAYLIWKYKYNLNYAINFIKYKKQDAFFWSINFNQALEKFYNDINKLTTIAAPSGCSTT